MSIYFDYTAGRGRYDDEEPNQSKFEQKSIVKEFSPNKKVFQQSNQQKSSVQFNAKPYVKNVNTRERNAFHYSPEQDSANQKESFTNNYQQKNQRTKRSFNSAQNYKKKTFNAYRTKKGPYTKPFEISIGSKYQKYDIQD